VRPDRLARYGETARPGSAAARWQQRRNARLARLSDTDTADGVAPPRRRSTASRRP
jgi:hypothetical protein